MELVKNSTQKQANWVFWTIIEDLQKTCHKTSHIINLEELKLILNMVKLWEGKMKVKMEL